MDIDMDIKTKHVHCIAWIALMFMYANKNRSWLLNTSIWIFYRQRCSYLSMWCQPIHLEMLYFFWFLAMESYERDLQKRHEWRCVVSSTPPEMLQFIQVAVVARIACILGLQFQHRSHELLGNNRFFGGGQCVTMKHIPTPYPDINMPFFAEPLAFSRPVRSLAANKALHRRSSRVWRCCGTYFFNCCDWEREKQAWWTCLPEDINIHTI